MSSAIDLNDSRVNRIALEQGIARVEFSHVYRYTSRGRPGVDPGSEFTQPVALFLHDAQMHGQPPQLPATVLEGCLEHGGRRDDLLAMPFLRRGPATLELRFEDGSTVRLTGQAPRVITQGPARFLE
jgi:hypothetical protein